MKANSLFKSLTYLIQEGKPNHNLAEQLYRELIRASQHAENTCGRQPLTYWCINLLHQLKEQLSVYGELRRLMNNKLSISDLLNSAQHIGITIQQNLSVQQMDLQIKTLQAEVKECHKESATKRQEYLLDQANIANNNDNHARAQALAQIRNSERRTEAYQHLNYNRTDTSIQRKTTRLKVPIS